MQHCNNENLESPSAGNYGSHYVSIYPMSSYSPGCGKSALFSLENSSPISPRLGIVMWPHQIHENLSPRVIFRYRRKRSSLPMRLLQTGCKHPAFPYGIRISLQNKTMHSWDRNIDTHIQVAYVLTIPSSGFTALSFASRTCSPGSCSSFFNPVSYSFQLLQPITFSPCEFSSIICKQNSPY